MPGPYNPPKKNQAWQTDIALADMANLTSLKITPTIAAGDFKCGGDGSAVANLTNIPTLDPTGTPWVRLSLTAGEMNFDIVVIQGIDQTSPKEWADFALTILTTA